MTGEARLTQDTEDNLVRARIHLLEQFPFFGELAKYLRPKITTEYTETACIDKHGQMYLNPHFANKATAKDLVFVLAHEVMHLVNGSAMRFPKGENFALWARAADIAINYLIVQEANVPLPRAALIRPLYHGFDHYFGMTHEEIYYELLKDAVYQHIALSDKSWCDEESCTCNEAFADPLEAATWERRIRAAAEVGRAAGKMPGQLESFLSTLGVAKKNWLRVLALATTAELKRTYSWRKPNRRTTGIGVITPTVIPERPEVVLYLDTSGSMCDTLLNEGLTEISSILTMAKTTLILGDAEVYFCGPVRREELKQLPMQRGGTDFNVVFERIEKEKLKPRLLIGFSDLEGPFPHEKPAYPVIWCRSSTSTREPPWGQLISM